MPRPVYPPPTQEWTKTWQCEVGWAGHPYFVEINSHDSGTTYISVKPRAGYMGLNAGNAGYIYSTEDPNRVKRYVEKCLRIAWKRGRNPRFVRASPLTVQTTLEQMGVRK